MNRVSNDGWVGGYVGSSLRVPHISRAIAVGFVLCCGDGSGALANAPAGPESAAAASAASNDAQNDVPHGSFFSSLKQAFKQDFDREVVRGHFDVGSAPDTHRYYCLVDPKTGKREPSGVSGQPIPRADGMTGIKASAVSLYACASAEQQGILVITGYTLSAGAGGLNTPPAPVQSQPAARTLPESSPDKVDVAGVKLGMSLDEVRRVLRSKQLLDYYESTEILAHLHSTEGAGPPIASGRFVNVIVAWTARPSSAVGGAVAEDGESYEVMFTPVPGKERAMAIIHSAGFSPANALRETALDLGLVKKYGGFPGSNDVPSSATWRIQSSGDVQVGDPCNRRALFGGLAELGGGRVSRPNLALKTAPDEFQFQIDRCGVAIVTEDHSTVDENSPRGERRVRRFTVTAYSPSIGFEGATTAARLIQAAGQSVDSAKAPRNTDQPAPDL
jgi:hypothetical protein